jgi:hypothetical protein
MATAELTDPEPPRHPVTTPREIGQRPSVTTVNMPGRGMTGRAAGCRLCGRDQEGNLGLRFINAPGVQSERCGLGQQMGQRVSNLPRCKSMSIFWTTSINRHR